MEEKKGLAVTSLVLGILSFACLGPLLGIPAIICGIVALGKVGRGEGSGKGLAIAGLALGGVNLVMVLLGALLLLPALNQARGKARRIADAANLKGIGQALELYTQDGDIYNPKYPDNLGALLEYLPGEYLVSPGSQTLPPATEEDVKNGRCDYIYLGAGKACSEVGGDEPIVITKSGLLGGAFVNVLYGDLSYVQPMPQPSPEIQELLDANR